MVNALVDEPMKFSLLIESPIDIIDLCNADENISKITNNAFEHHKGL